MNKQFFNENVKGMTKRVALTFLCEIIIIIPYFWTVQDIGEQLIGGTIALVLLIVNILVLYHQNGNIKRQRAHQKDNIKRQRTNEPCIARGIRILFWEIPMKIEDRLETISITGGMITLLPFFVISLLKGSELSALILTIAAATVSICQLFKVRFYSLLDMTVTAVTAIMTLYLLIIKPVNTITNCNIELSVWNGISLIILSISIYQEYQFIAENKKAIEENNEDKKALEQEKNKEIRSKIEEILTKNLEQSKKDNPAIDVSKITQEIMKCYSER